jgi:hypothetical protein
MAFPSNSILPPLLPPSYFRPILFLPHFNTHVFSLRLSQYTTYFFYLTLFSLSSYTSIIYVTNSGPIVDQNPYSIKKYITPFFTDQYIHSLLNFHNNIYMLSSLCACLKLYVEAQDGLCMASSLFPIRITANGFWFRLIYTAASRNADLV